MQLEAERTATMAQIGNLVHPDIKNSYNEDLSDGAFSSNSEKLCSFRRKFPKTCPASVSIPVPAC